MALDRQSIEKQDFPVGRRGYDPGAVDAHLSALADEVAELRRSARRRSDTLASSASEQVRAIVDAAETSAADIQRTAEDEARQIRAEAVNEAQAAHEEAAAQAREYVDKVSEAANNMLQRLDAIELEFGALMESLRTGSKRLRADLELLEGNLAEVSAATLPRPSYEVEVEVEEVAVVADVVIEAESAVVVEGPAESMDGEAAPEQGGVAPEDMAGAPADDAEGARLIALNMALNGTPREETDRYLAENFELSGRESLLDEVYASVNA